MLGGLMFEVLTSGLAPFYWLNPSLTAQVRRRAPFKLQSVDIARNLLERAVCASVVCVVGSCFFLCSDVA